MDPVADDNFSTVLTIAPQDYVDFRRCIFFRMFYYSKDIGGRIGDSSERISQKFGVLSTVCTDIKVIDFLLFGHRLSPDGTTD